MFTEQYTDEEMEAVNTVHLGNDEVAFDIPVDLDNEKVAKHIDKFKWVATYRFSDRIRNPRLGGKRYGSTGMSYRNLYRLLCERFNEGQYFIDDYFDKVYPMSSVKERADSYLKELSVLIGAEYSLSHKASREKKQAKKAEESSQEIRQSLESAKKTKKGTYDLRYKGTRAMLKALDELDRISEQYENTRKQLSEYKAFKKSEFESAGEKIAEDVREDIIQCLATGIIPLNFSLKEKTKKIRLSKGLPEEPPFYATGRFIRGIILTYRLEENKNGNIYRRKL